MRSRLGPGTQALLDMCITCDVGTTFLGDGEDSAAGPLQRTYFAESNAKTSAERSRQLPTLRKKKQRSQSTVDAKRATEEQEFKSRKHVLDILHKPGI